MALVETVKPRWSLGDIFGEEIRDEEICQIFTNYVVVSG